MIDRANKDKKEKKNIEGDFFLAEQLIGASVDGIVAFDKDCRYLFWNRAMERISGYSQEQVLGKTAFEVFPFIKQTNEDQRFYEALEGKTSVSRNRPFLIEETGREGFYEAFYSPLRNEQGGVVGGVAVVRDITDRKRAEDASQETDERFRTMANRAPVLLWMSGTDSLCNFFNQTWLNFTGRTMNEEMGVGWGEGVHPEDLQNVVDVYMQSFAKRKEFEMEYRLRRADGEYRWILDHGTPRYTPDGNFAGYIGSCIDITDRKQAEQGLKEIADCLIRSNHDLERFAYIASHDLQEPLRTMINYTQLVEKKYRGKLDPEADELMKFTVQEGKRMKQLIDDLLAYARLERKDSPLQTVDFNIVVNEVIQSLQVVIKESKAKIECGSLPVFEADRIQIIQLFQNLISNGIKFRGKDPCVVRISSKKDRNEWVFCVEDNGIGFEMKYVTKIFMIFQRLQKKDQYPGSGIGLATCKKIVESHGGKIWAESEPGMGSKFFFTLPCKSS